MTVKLYFDKGSPTARAAMMACEIFSVPVEMIQVNLLEGEQMKPEYLKKNPLHSVPVLEDGDLILHDSHAILMYLADAYGKNDSMYPKDVKKRAIVNQMSYFESSILYRNLLHAMLPLYLEGAKSFTEKHLSGISKSYEYLEEFLSRNKYLAGDAMTIADISAFATITCSYHVVPIDDKKYPKISAWIKVMEAQPFSQKYNAPGSAGYGLMIKKFLGLL